MSSRRYPLRARFSLLVATLLWASAFVGIRAGLQGGYHPGPLALLRFTVASVFTLCLLPLLPAQRQRIRLRDKLRLFLIGVLGLGCYNLALNYGEVAVTSGIASFIISLSPVVTLIFAALFLSER